MKCFELQLTQGLQRSWRTVKQYPRVLWLPALVLSVLVVSGVVAVVWAAEAQAESDKSSAAQDCQIVATYLMQVLLSATQATESLAGWLANYPSFPEANETFNRIADKLLVQVRNLSPDTYLVISPFGIYANVQPVNQFSAGDVGYNQFLQRRSVAQTSIAQIKARSTTLRGPFQSLILDPRTNTSTNFIYGFHPVMVPNVTRDETFGIPWPQDNCPADVCYDAATGTKFWGFAVARIPSDPLLLDGSSILSRLRARGYIYQLIQTTNQTLRSTNPPTPGYTDHQGNNATLVASYGGGQLVDPVESVIAVPDVALFQPMTLMISKPHGWAPSWKTPMIAVVVVFSAVVSALIAVFMVWNIRLKESTRLLQEEMVKSDKLLYSMLPTFVADKLRRGDVVEATDYQEVAILFSDIVGFTEISAQSSPRDVCMMLNDLYNVFDSIIILYPELYKVETIGDAYMVVSNVVKQSDSHVDCMIEFAIRMQQAARTVKSTLGESINIRVGIHVGSTVASVVGAKMPRFCFFGDAINTASRMESHGLPGHVHISSAARQAIKDKDRFAMQDRGMIQIKGKGAMRTCLISTDTAGLALGMREEFIEDAKMHLTKPSLATQPSFFAFGPGGSSSFQSSFLETADSAVLCSAGPAAVGPHVPALSVSLASAMSIKPENLKSPAGSLRRELSPLHI